MKNETEQTDDDRTQKMRRSTEAVSTADDFPQTPERSARGENVPVHTDSAFDAKSAARNPGDSASTSVGTAPDNPAPTASKPTPAPGDSAQSADKPISTTGNGGDQLLAEPEVQRLRGQWREVQTLFVDDPRDAVTRANELVDGAIHQLADTCAQRRQELETQWSRSEDADTEALRQALRGYRHLFDQLVGGAASVATNR
ncbi:hypothetical protein AB0N05_33115 [Nocardia sp. NPDC051030]|uniref:hypothetical protein n=1 Tax=Nocardia sp. NPDC051030 TaxID=3155162 RepID=UPI00341C0D64